MAENAHHPRPKNWEIPSHEIPSVSRVVVRDIGAYEHNYTPQNRVSKPFPQDAEVGFHIWKRSLSDGLFTCGHALAAVAAAAIPDDHAARLSYARGRFNAALNPSELQYVAFMSGIYRAVFTAS